MSAKIEQILSNYMLTRNDNKVVVRRWDSCFKKKVQKHKPKDKKICALQDDESLEVGEAASMLPAMIKPVLPDDLDYVRIEMF